MIEKCLFDVDPGEDVSDELLYVPGIRVLVADLFPVIADICTMILNASGFSAFSAHSVGHAVRIASENAIDVAFIELLIGDTDAIDAAVRILALRPYCRIVIWTGRREPVLSWVRREAARQFGGCELLCKPIHPRDILRIARGEPVPRHCIIRNEPRGSAEIQPVTPIAEEYCLSGPALHEYLNEAREVLLKLPGGNNL
jgi:CheY-like chemotaxis protein